VGLKKGEEYCFFFSQIKLNATGSHHLPKYINCHEFNKARKTKCMCAYIICIPYIKHLGSNRDSISIHVNSDFNLIKLSTYPLSPLMLSYIVYIFSIDAKLYCPIRDTLIQLRHDLSTLPNSEKYMQNNNGMARSVMSDMNGVTIENVFAS